MDLTNPHVRELMRFYQERAQLAVDTVSDIAEAVRPIYFMPRARVRPEHIGSCVVVRFGNEHFLLSASHAFERLGNRPPLVPCGTTFCQLVGERFSFQRGKSGTHADDPIDATSFHIQSEVPEEIRKCALPSDVLERVTPVGVRSFLAAVGYRLKNSTVRGGVSSSTQDIFPSIEVGHDEYQALGLDQGATIALAFESDVVVDGRMRRAPHPKGMSGGAIFRISGVSPDPEIEPRPALGVTLAAIIIEHKLERGKAPAVLLGTNVFAHIELVRRYLPAALADAE